MYKLINDRFGNLSCIFRTTDSASIPVCADNTDYANFKKEVLAGAELQDADGNVMTTEKANAFIGTLS
jgi:hypothetical protein